MLRPQQSQQQIPQRASGPVRNDKEWFYGVAKNWGERFRKKQPLCPPQVLDQYLLPTVANVARSMLPCGILMGGLSECGV
jgi:hypothetical protein